LFFSVPARIALVTKVAAHGNAAAFGDVLSSMANMTLRHLADNRYLA
jgi:hypothetical protein